jgi:hypothetical protein
MSLLICLVSKIIVLLYQFRDYRRYRCKLGSVTKNVGSHGVERPVSFYTSAVDEDAAIPFRLLQHSFFHMFLLKAKLASFRITNKRMGNYVSNELFGEV